jgi:flagellar basal-body rod protein FlgB
MTEPLQMLRGGPRPSTSSKPDDDFASRALLFGAQRQTQLASNIANADTPNYKAMDVSFQDSLHAATVADSGTPAMQPGVVTLAMTAPKHIPAVSHTTESTLAFARYVEPAQPRLDGNTVDLDRERGEFSKNAILYRFAVMTLDDESKEFKQAASDPRMAPR